MRLHDRRPTAAPVEPRAGSAIRIATANVYDGNPTPEATIAALRARAVDVLATVEMDGTFWRQLDGIDAFPYRVVVGELGVHARWPLALMPAQGLPRSRSCGSAWTRPMPRSCCTWRTR